MALWQRGFEPDLTRLITGGWWGGSVDSDVDHNDDEEQQTRAIGVKTAH